MRVSILWTLICFLSASVLYAAPPAAPPAVDVTLAQITGGVSSSPLVAGTTDQAVIGFSLANAHGSTINFSNVSFGVSNDPNNHFTNFRLFSSSNNTFGPADTDMGLSPTVTATTVSFSLSNPIADGSTAFFFLVADVSSAANSTSSTIQFSLSNSGVTVSAGTLSSSSFSGPTYSFKANVTIASLAAGAAASPLVASATAKAILGFSVTSSSTAGTFSAVDVPVSQDPTGLLSNYKFYISSDGTFDAGDTQIGGATITPSATKISITTIGENLSSSGKNYFLVADVGSGVSTATSSETLSFDETKVTTTETVAAVTITGTTYSFQHTVTIAQLGGGIAPSPLSAGATGKAILGFSLTASASIGNFTAIDIHTTSDPTNVFTNYKFYLSSDGTFDAGDTQIGTATITPSATKISITGLTSSLQTAGKNYFLVADVLASVSGATPSIQLSFASTDVTTAAFEVPPGTVTGINYAFGGTATITQLTTGVATSPLNSGATDQAILGFATSSGSTPTLTAINISLSSNPAGKITNVRIFKSTDNSYGPADTNIATASVVVTATQIQITGLSEAVPGNYFIVADVATTVNSGTTALKPSFTDSDVTMSGAAVSPVTINGTNYSFLDVTPPNVTAFSPVNGSTTVQISTTQISITFDENVARVSGAATTNNQRVRLFEEGVQVLAIDRDDTDLAFSGNTLTITINPGYVLKPLKNYNVLVGNAVVMDTETPGNNFAGLSAATDWAFKTSGVTITSPSALNACAGSYQTLGNIDIVETGAGDFNNNGGTRTLVLGFSSGGFVFEPNPSVNVSVVDITGHDITSISGVSTFTSLTISYTITGTSQREMIRISGLRISPDGTQPTANIIRSGGNANQDNNNGTGGSSLTYATVNSGATPGTPVVSFTPNNYCQGTPISPGPTVTSNNTNVKWYSDINLTAQITGLSNPAAPTAADMLLLGFVTTNAGVITRYVTQTPATCQSAATAVTLTVNQSFVGDLLITTGSSTLCNNLTNGAYALTPITFTATPAGANNYNFRVNGISAQNSASNTFSPTVVHNGDLVTVDITKASFCPTPLTVGPISMTVHNAPDPVNFVLAFPPTNTSDSAVFLSNQQDSVSFKGTPSGGTFSGTSMVNNYFYPKTVGIGGPFTLAYTVTDINGCVSRRTRDYNVYDGSTAIVGLANTYCSTDLDVTIGLNSRPGYALQYLYAPLYYGSPSFPGIKTTNGLDPIVNNEPGPSGNLRNWLPLSYWTYIGLPATPPTPTGYGGAPFTVKPSVLAMLAAPGATQVQVTIGAGYLPIGPGSFEYREQIVTISLQPPAPTTSTITSYCTADDIANNVIAVTTIDPAAVVRWYSDAGLTTELTSISNKLLPKLFELGVVNHTANTYSLYMTQTIGGCPSPPQTVVIKVFANPGAPSTTYQANYCAFDALNPITVNNSPGTTVNWFSDAGLTKDITSGVLNPSLARPSELGIDGTIVGPNSRYVTQTANGCQSTATTVNIAINPIPTAPLVTDSNPTFCQNADITTNPPINVTSGTNIKWYTDPALTAMINPANQFHATSAELGLDSSVPGTTVFYVTQTVAGCQSRPVQNVGVEGIPVVINSLSSVAITSTQPLDGICKTGTLIGVTGSPGGGTWSGGANAALINVVQGTNPSPNSTADLDPSNNNLLPGQVYTLTYTAVGTGCSNSASKTVKILPSIAPSMTSGIACSGLFVDLTNTSVVTTTSLPPSTIASVGWNFGDGNVLSDSAFTAAVPASASLVGTKGTYAAPQHQYKTQGNYPIKFRMVTSDGCIVDGSTNLTVSPLPAANFSWGIPCAGSTTEFHATITNGVNVPANNYIWDFHKTNTLSGVSAGSSGTTANPLVDYTNLGRDSVQLIVVSNAFCRDTIQKPVFIVPVGPAIISGSQYAQNFNTDDGGWIAGGVNSSWQYGTPAGSVIKTDSSATGTGKAWKTNLTGDYNSNEKSWVMSPCFDFSNAAKPVISLDIFSDTPKGIDGAVLQYCLVDDISNDANWNNVGVPGVGVNWYEAFGVSSDPGNQGAGAKGWTGDASSGKYSHWVHAVYAIDVLVGKPSVKFRIAFGGNAHGEGFAFDNLVIGERSRSVLVENFTNTSIAAGQAAKDQNTYYNNFKGNTTEAVRIQYHTNFPGPDPIYEDNKTMYDSRVAFYGLTSAPAARLDGAFQAGNFTTWGNAAYDDRVLQPSPVKIVANPTKQSDGTVQLNVSLIVDAQATIPKNSFLYAVVLENSITDPQWLGANNDTEFKYVAKQILPSPAGYKIDRQLNSGETFVVPADAVVWEKQNLYTTGAGSLAIFLQQNEPNNKSVYQALLVQNPVHPDLVTGLEPGWVDIIQIYPNPANTQFIVQLPSAVSHDVDFQLWDQMGKLVNTSVLRPGTSTHAIGTGNLAGGMYILHISGGGTFMRKKVMVIHND